MDLPEPSTSVVGKIGTTFTYVCRILHLLPATVDINFTYKATGIPFSV